MSYLEVELADAAVGTRERLRGLLRTARLVLVVDLRIMFEFSNSEFRREFRMFEWYLDGLQLGLCLQDGLLAALDDGGLSGVRAVLQLLRSNRLMTLSLLLFFF